MESKKMNAENAELDKRMQRVAEQHRDDFFLKKRERDM
jgi:hypothetical protein